jgi:hypothetical protein
MITAFHKVKTPPLWAKCLIASIGLHSVALYVMLQNPVLLKRPWTSLFSPSTPLLKYISVDEEWNSDALVLDHFFEEFPQLPKKSKTSLEVVSLATLKPLQEQSKEIAIHLPSSFFLKETPAAEESLKAHSLSFDLAEEELNTPALTSFVSRPTLKTVYQDPVLHDLSFDIQGAEPLEVHHISNLPTARVSKEPVSLSPKETKDGIALEEQGITPSSNFNVPYPEHGEDTQLSLKAPTFNHFLQEMPMSSLSGASFSDIDTYFSENLISAIEWNNDFDVKASLFPQQDGYVFSVGITPTKNLEEQKIKQNFYFLIDNSSDIEKHKLAVFKRSVLKALSALKPGDCFNIFLVDKKTVKLSTGNLIVSPKNIQLAEEFLERKGEDRPLFSSLNLNQSLNDLLTSVEVEDEVHTAILLTNGKATLPPKDLRRFLEKNHGKINLFTAAVGQNNHLTFLDLISSFSGGSLFYSDTNASFPRKLAAFVKGLEAPLAKNLTYSLLASNSDANVSLSDLGQLPNLYNKTPFVITGKMDRLCDLELILQGSSAEDQIFLKKVIHFEEASAPDSAVKKQWLLHQRNELYEKFLKDPRPSHLEKATDLLKAIHGKAFTQ